MAKTPRTRGSLELRGDQVGFTRRVYLPVQQFIQTEWIGSAFLLAAAIVALVWANPPWADAYHGLWETRLTIDVGLFSISKDLHHWVNDGLMAIFFFVVGLEIKREVLHGNLSEPRQAALPMMAALGGMVVPALAYWLLNAGGPGVSGWGIPMATDIAFALGVLGLLGRSIPTQVRIFLLALAIVDDLGAILVIALFYTETLEPMALVWAAGLLGGILAMRKAGVRSVGAYSVVGFLFWAAFLQSGIHATLAGVILGAVTPSRPFFDHRTFSDRAGELLATFKGALDAGDHDVVEATLGRMEELTEGTEAPLEKLERTVHPWSAYLVLPLFALANSGVSLSGEAVRAAAESPVTLGVVLGLVLGKLVGVLGGSWLGVRLGWAVLPPGVRWIHLAGTALLAGIGFTVSLFIAELAFQDPAMVAQAKVGILVASLVAGVGGYLFLRLGAGSGGAPEPGR